MALQAEHLDRAQQNGVYIVMEYQLNLFRYMYQFPKTLSIDRCEFVLHQENALPEVEGAGNGNSNAGETINRADGGCQCLGNSLAAPIGINGKHLAVGPFDEGSAYVKQGRFGNHLSGRFCVRVWVLFLSSQ